MNIYKYVTRVAFLLIAMMMSVTTIMAQSGGNGYGDFDPSNPGNPGSNGWNAATGEVIIDDFTTGNLNSAIKTVIGSSGASAVTQIVVSGSINRSDFTVANSYSNCTLIDFSRTAGLEYVPSSAYSGNAALCSILLPTSITSIQSSAFKNCTSLTSLTSYTLTPPTVTSNAFEGVGESLVVYVPADAVDAYMNADVWKNFTILPIQSSVHSVTIGMPEGTDMSIYKNMNLQLVNAKSGQKYKYILTDKMSYRFGNLVENTIYNAYVLNEKDSIFGKIENITLNTEDVTATFATLAKPQQVSLSIVTPEGKDVTSETTVTWTDANGNYIGQAYSIAGQKAGTQLKYRVVLPEALAIKYASLNATDYTVAEGNNSIICKLDTIQKIKVSGNVKDAATNLAISSAVVTASQTFGGKYTRTVSTKTDTKGNYTLEISSVPTSLAVAATDYITKSIPSDSLNIGKTDITVPDVKLKSISGAVINLGFTYTESKAEGEEAEVQNWYDDYNNVDYSIYDKTSQKNITQFSVQYPKIVLLEDVAEGDVLELTASSRKSAFTPVTTSVTINAEQNVDVTFNVVELGSIKSSFVNNANATVVGILYNADGKMLKNSQYSDGALEFSDLADGSYTLVTMGSSTLFNNVYDLSQFEAAGLSAGTDYVQNNVAVKSGEIVNLSIAEVPVFNDSKLHYTGDNTSFTVNKSSIVAGNYLTLTGHIDFKSEYASEISDVNLIVDLPESCSFVENSVMVGNSTGSYSVDGSRITIPMANYSDRVRFCIIPTESGDYAPSALVQFSVGGNTISQPIGSANYTAKNLSINVPSVTAKKTIPVSGTAVGVCDIDIYDGDVLIGQTKSLANGVWSTTCELNDAYNMSMHKIHALVNSAKGTQLSTESGSCQYDENAIQVSKVVMYHENPEQHKTYALTFDFLNPSTAEENYIYYIYNKKFTFTIDFTDNDTTKVSNVVLYVKTAKTGWYPLDATYDKKLGKWFASGEFGNMYDGDLPVNVNVDYQLNIEPQVDRTQCNKIEIQTIKNLQDDKEFISLIEKYNEAITLKEESEMERLFNLIMNNLGINYTYNPEDHIDLTDDELEKMEYEGNILYDDILKHHISFFGDSVKWDVPLDNGIYHYSCQKYSDVMSEYNNFSDFEKWRLNDSTFVNLFCSNNKTILIDSCSNFYLNMEFEELNVQNAKSTKIDLSYLDWCISYYTEQYNNFQNKAAGILEGVKTFNSWLGAQSLETERRMNKYLHFASGYKYGKYWNQPKPNGYYKALQQASKEESYLKQLKAASKNVGRFLKVFDIAGMLNDFKKAIDSFREWKRMITTIESINCPGMDKLAIKAKNYSDRAARGYATELAFDISMLAVGDKLAEAGAVGLVCSASINDFMIIQNGYTEYKDIKWQSEIQLAIPNLKCEKPKKGGNGNSDSVTGGAAPITTPPGKDSNCPDKKYGIDPSGYVYEGVFSNRLQGVTATAYYKEDVEDMYGDKHENIIKWDAAEYAQENPLFTDENGYYRWDVPQGLWQVKFEKAGYETTYSDWLPVPPPQLDINIPMTQNTQPEVKTARAFDDAVTVEFDKYMLPDLLTTDNITVKADGKAVEGTIALLNEEAKCEGATDKYASKVRFNAAKPFSASEVTLTVSRNVKSYAGITMENDFSQTFTVEHEVQKIECDSAVAVNYGGSKAVTVSVLPASASAGKTLRVKNSSSMILSASATDVVLDAEGKAAITVSGELPGTAALTYTIDGYDISASQIVNVEDKANETVAAPVASIASGSAVAKGTEVTLTTTEKNAKIYYTLDGSCPCENASRILYEKPIVIDADVTIKAMVIASDGTESDVVTFVYTIDKESGIKEVNSNQHVNIGNILAIYNLNGVKLSTSNTSKLENGIYIILTENDGKQSYVKYVKN